MTDGLTPGLAPEAPQIHTVDAPVDHNLPAGAQDPERTLEAPDADEQLGQDLKASMEAATTDIHQTSRLDELVEKADDESVADQTLAEAGLNLQEVSPDIREELESVLQDLDEGSRLIAEGSKMVEEGSAKERKAGEKVRQLLNFAAAKEATAGEPATDPDREKIPDNVVQIRKFAAPQQTDASRDTFVRTVPPTELIEVPEHLQPTLEPELRPVPDLITSDQVPVSPASEVAPQPAPAPMIEEAPVAPAEPAPAEAPQPGAES